MTNATHRERYSGIAGAALLALAATVNALAAGPVLAPAAGSPFAVGGKPTGVATGDFNGDGKADIAVSNSQNNTVSILLGNGAGNFVAGPGGPFTTGSKPMSIVVKDFNQDGKLDLAIVNQQSNNVTLLLGTGTGAFVAAAGSPFAVGGVPNFAATGDFNSDGKPDLAVSNSSTNNLTLLLGNGGGGFTPAPGSPFATGPLPEGVAAADFDNNGKLDLAVANGGDGKVTMLFGDGAGGFSSTQQVQGANAAAMAVASLYGVTVGDFYSHGLPDLITIGSAINEVNLLRAFNNSSPSYNAQFNVFAPINAVAGDFDADGKQDLAVVSAFNQLEFLAGNGNGNFNVGTAPTYATGTNPWGAATADFNNDGRPDVVVSNQGDNTISVFLTNGPQLPPPAVPPVSSGGPVTQPQSIIFTVTDHMGSDPPFPLVAVATSGLPVVFTVLGGPATISGNTLTLTGLGDVTVQAYQAGNGAYNEVTTVQTFHVTLGHPAIRAVVNGASFRGGKLAPNSYAAILGANLGSGSSSGDASATKNLAGVTVTVVDALKKTFAANLWFTSYGQINFVVPAEAAPGAASVTVTNNIGDSVAFEVTIDGVSPGLFSADGTGSGPTAAEVQILHNGVPGLAPASFCMPTGCSAKPIATQAGTQVYLTFFGTGIRGASGLADVSLTLGGTVAQVLYAGPQGNYPGLDQVNVAVPTSMNGAGLVDAKLTVDGVVANPVKVLFE